MICCFLCYLVIFGIVFIKEERMLNNKAFTLLEMLMVLFIIMKLMEISIFIQILFIQKIIH